MPQRPGTKPGTGPPVPKAASAVPEEKAAPPGYTPRSASRAERKRAAKAAAALVVAGEVTAAKTESVAPATNPDAQKPSPPASGLCKSLFGSNPFRTLMPALAALTGIANPITSAPLIANMHMSSPS